MNPLEDETRRSERQYDPEKSYSLESADVLMRLQQELRDKLAAAELWPRPYDAIATAYCSLNTPFREEAILLHAIDWEKDHGRAGLRIVVRHGTPFDQHARLIFMAIIARYGDFVPDPEHPSKDEETETYTFSAPYKNTQV